MIQDKNLEIIEIQFLLNDLFILSHPVNLVLNFGFGFYGLIYFYAQFPELFR